MSAIRFSRAEIGGAGLAWASAAAFMAALFIALAPAYLFDPRLFNGAPLWDKPLKFALSLSLHFLTLAALVQMLPPAQRGGLALGFAVITSIAAGVLEIAYIALQAMRGRASHYNYETALESQIYIAMGVGAVLLILAAFILGVKIARIPGEPPSGLRDGAMLGLIFGPVLTLVVAGYMSQNGSHYVNAPLATDQNGVFLFGWSTSDPDLRPAHFFALHMMQAAPLAGWVGDRIGPRTGSACAFVAAALFGMTSIAAFAIALSGQSPLWFL
jgi:hypothetical protein